ncbi:6-phosphogluconolactonase [Mucilaginibacter sp.]
MVNIFKSQQDIIATAAKMFAEAAQKAIQERGKFVVSLTGGTSPEALYNLLAAPPYRDNIDWSKLYIFWGDERWVPLTDDKSNGKMTDRTLLNKVPVPADHIHYMYADGQQPQDFAAAYEQSIRQVLGEDLSFDLILLGMGPEGHTASLFPHEPVLHEKDKLVEAYYLQSQSMFRITLTPPIINKAKQIIVMLFGEEKAAALHQVLEGEYNPDLYPAQLIKPLNGTLTWLTDEAVAKDLTHE